MGIVNPTSVELSLAILVRQMARWRPTWNPDYAKFADALDRRGCTATDADVWSARDISFTRVSIRELATGLDVLTARKPGVDVTPKLGRWG
jgi:hypothetical protein